MQLMQQIIQSFPRNCYTKFKLIIALATHFFKTSNRLNNQLIGLLGNLLQFHSIFLANTRNE